MTVHAQDDAFREIQLNGKQLVFVFMVATVASVVIFLCGVFVGRGVRAERGGTEEAAALIEAPAADVAAATNAGVSTLAQGSGDSTTAAPPPTVDDQSYVARLEKRAPSVEDLEPAARPPATGTGAKASSGLPRSAEQKTPTPSPPPVAENRPVAAPRPAAPAVADATPAPAQAAFPSQGFVVQVAALNVRSEADAIVKRLVSRGYAAFIQAPAGGPPVVFRVRVGPFSTRREAEALATRLRQEEQFKPWVTR